MKKGSMLIALTGPAGAGKTTIGGLVAKEISNSVNMDVDYLKHFIVNGFVYDKSSRGVEQWELLGDNIGMLADNFLNSGYNTIINGYISVSAWEKIQRHVKLTHKILLLPVLETVIRRDAGRIPDMRMGQGMIEEHHGHFSSHDFYKDFTKIDSSTLSEQETLAAVMKLITPSETES